MPNLQTQKGVRHSSAERGQEPGNSSDAEAVQGLLKVRMTTDEPIAFADEWAATSCSTWHPKAICVRIAGFCRRINQGGSRLL